jgi:hypothetical protein
LAFDSQQNVTPLTRSSQNSEITQSTTHVRGVVILF